LCETNRRNRLSSETCAERCRHRGGWYSSEPLTAGQ
jgi:hypothetical protein